MPDRISQAFARARRDNRPLVVAYLCIGDPSVEASFHIARALLEAGADVLELGAPFSDPTADGPVIARASARAIAQGGSMRAAIEVGRRLREQSDAPLVLFGYMNPVAVRGERDVVRAVAAAGIDAMLLVDLPPEEGRELRQEANAQGIVVIPLLTPTSERARIDAVRGVAQGFVYYVSVTGVTGVSGEAELDRYAEAGRAASQVRKDLGLPVVVGFGIDSAEKARMACGSGDLERGADGVVVGSAIVKAIEACGSDHEAAARAAARVIADLRRGLQQR